MKPHDTSMTLLALLAALTASPAVAHGVECAKPYQQSGTVSLPVNFSGSTATLAVPAGYRLQIEYVSTSMRLSSNTDRAGFSLSTTAGGVSGNYQLPAVLGYATIDWIASTTMPLYADKNSTIYLYFSRLGSYSSAVSGQYALSGCLYPA